MAVVNKFGSDQAKSGSSGKQVTEMASETLCLSIEGNDLSMKPYDIFHSFNQGSLELSCILAIRVEPELSLEFSPE